MRYCKLLLCLALCLAGTGARAQMAAATAAGTGSQPVLGSMGGLLTGQPMAGGMAATFKDSLGAMQQGMATMAGALGEQFAAAGAQAEAALAAFEAQYCTPATFIPSEKVPATFVGHSMAVTFSLGNCTFNESKWLHDDIKELDCGEPSISYVKTPANFTSKYHSAPIFTSKVCKVEKTFGESEQKVLFVFDGTQAPDMNTLVAKITEEVKGVLGSVSSGAQNFINNAKSNLGGLLAGNGRTGMAPAFSYP